MERKTSHVVISGSRRQVPDGKGRWDVKSAGSKRATANYGDKSDAVFKAKEVAKNTPLGQTLKPIVIVALRTGMRKSEILGLKWHDVDIKRNIIHLYDTKNGEKREVSMNEVVQKTVIGVFKNPESQYVFCNKDNKPYGNVRKSFFTALKKAGIINLRFHDLGHTFASQLVMS